MSKGGFIDRSFYFVGDGRTAGTTLGDLPDAQGLAIQTVLNVAGRLVLAGWEIDDDHALHGGTSTVTTKAYSITIDGEGLVLGLLIDTDNTMCECPLIYNDTGSRLSLFYSWSANGMTEKTVNNYSNYFGSFGTYDYRWVPKTGYDYCFGLTMVYIPPTGDPFKTANISNIANSGKTSIAYANTSNTTYNYHVITKNDLVGIFLRADNWSSSISYASLIKGFICGQLIDNCNISTDNYKYGVITTGIYTSTNNMNEKDGNVSFHFTNRNTDINSNEPWIQFHNTSGSVIACYPGTDNSIDRYGFIHWNNAGLWSANAYDNEGQLHYSKLMIGTNPYRQALSSYTKQYVETQTQVCTKGTIDDTVLIKIGFDYKDTYFNWPEVGKTYDNGNYVNLGSGILMGWDSSNASIMDNSTTEIAEVEDITPSTPVLR